MERLPQREDIQGLRAVAVLAVILFHVDRRWLPGGFTGVDIFLVISGFLITSIIVRQQSQGSFSFLSFYASRIRRIVPAYLVLLAGVTACTAVLLTPEDFSRFWASLQSALYFSSNNFFARQSDYFAPAAHELPLLHTWSLAVEMQFYLLLPAMLAVIPRRVAGVVVTAAALFILGLVVVPACPRRPPRRVFLTARAYSGVPDRQSAGVAARGGELVRCEGQPCWVRWPAARPDGFSRPFR